MSARHQSNQIITGVASLRRGWRTAGCRVAPLVGPLPHRSSVPGVRLTAGFQERVDPPRKARAGTRAGQAQARPWGGWGWLLILALLVSLAGCSTIRLGYEKLPFLAGWEIDRYLDLDREQKAVVDRQLRAIQAWHRVHQLPRYAAVLKQVEDEIEQPVTTADVADWRSTLLATWPALIDQLAPAVAELGATLTPAQLAHLEKRLAEANDKLAAEFFDNRDPAGARTARLKRSRERAENFLGPLNAPQLTRLEQRVDQQGSQADSYWWSLRLPRQQALVGLLRELSTAGSSTPGSSTPGSSTPGSSTAGSSTASLSPAEGTALARRTLLALVSPTDPALAARVAAANDDSDRYLADMLGQTSVVQRRHLVERLRGYGGDLERLMASNPVVVD